MYYVPLLFKQNIFLLILIKMVIKPWLFLKKNNYTDKIACWSWLKQITFVKCFWNPNLRRGWQFAIWIFVWPPFWKKSPTMWLSNQRGILSQTVGVMLFLFNVNEFHNLKLLRYIVPVLRSTVKAVNGFQSDKTYGKFALWHHSI